MRVVFFGTPHLAAQLLKVLLKSKHEIVAVVTQADKPQGRHQHMAVSAVKKLSLEMAPELPIFQPLKAREPDFIEAMKALKADLFVVAAYGQILPQNLLDVPTVDCINVHYSLLPLLRGAAPIQRCILEGHKQTGVCIMKMVLAMDAGPVYAVEKVDLDDTITSGELSERLTEVAGPLLLKVMDEIASQKATVIEQDHSKMTLAPKIETVDAKIDWTASAQEIQRKVRSMDPAPGAWCEVYIRGVSKRLKFFSPKIVDQSGVAGEILAYGKRLVIGTGTGAVEFLKVQPEGKPQMAVSAWCNGQDRNDVRF